MPYGLEDYDENGIATPIRVLPQADAEALEYNQSLAMSDEDSEFIESVYNAAEDESDPMGDDQ